jgi:hypothetical protein
MVTKEVGRIGPSSRELEGIRERLRDSFFMVNSHTIPVEEMPGAGGELSACHRRLLALAKERGWSAALDVCQPGEALISRGVDHGNIAGSVVDYTQDVGCEWKATPIHLARQERSPKIIVAQSVGGVPAFVERKIKGGGVRDHIGQRSPPGSAGEYIVRREDVVHPFAVTRRLMARFDEIWEMEVPAFNSRSMWGAATKAENQREMVNMLGIHHLLMSVDDGKPAGVHVPVGVVEVGEVPVVVDGAKTMVPIADYLTNPRIHCVKDLLLLGYWAQRKAREQGIPEPEQDAVDAYVRALEENDTFFERRRNYRSRRFLSTLAPDDVAGIEGSRFFEQEEAEKLAPARRKAGPVIAKTFGISQLHGVGGDDTRIQEFLDHVLYDSASKGDIDTAMRIIYANYGEKITLPAEGPKLAAVEKTRNADAEGKNPAVLAYLREIYLLNQEAADRILRRFTHAFYRDIGALHGAGGYFGGYQPPRTSAGALDRFGAPYGGSVECRNADFLGCKHDLDARTHLPFLRRDAPTPDEDTVREMQLKDLYLAEITLGKFNTLMTGRPEDERVFGLTDLRSTVYMRLDFARDDRNRVKPLRRRLEDLRTGGSGTGYSEHFRRLQAYREEVYQDFFGRGRGFAAGLNAGSRATQDTA